MPKEKTEGKKKKQRGPSPVLIARLATPVDRPEFVDTPGPYQTNDRLLAEKGTIPYHFRTSERWPRDKPPLKDSITVNYSAVEPSPVVATISNEPRWPPSKEVAPTQYDVLRGLNATESKSFAATFTSQPRKFHTDIPESSNTSVHAPTEHLTIAHTFIKGGAFTNSKRDTSEYFVKDAGKSSAVVYKPNMAAVEPKPSCATFATVPREPEVKTVGPGPLAYSDSVHQAQKLSTSSRSPNVVFSRVPAASSMPYPFNKANLCNSRSMRTKFCVSNAVPQGNTTQQSNASHRPHSAASFGSRVSPIPARPHSATSMIRELRQSKRTVADSPFTSRKLGAPIHSQEVCFSLGGQDGDDNTPFGIRISHGHEEEETDGHEATNADNYDTTPPLESRANLSAFTRPASATPAHLRPSGPPEHSDNRIPQHSPAMTKRTVPSGFTSQVVEPVPRFAFAAKYPQRFKQQAAEALTECNASGAMEGILSEAKRVFPLLLL